MLKRLALHVRTAADERGAQALSEARGKVRRSGNFAARPPTACIGSRVQGFPRRSNVTKKSAFMVPDKVRERRLIQLAQYISELFVIAAAARKAAAIGLAQVRMSVFPCLRLISPFLSR